MTSFVDFKPYTGHQVCSQQNANCFPVWVDLVLVQHDDDDDDDEERITKSFSSVYILLTERTIIKGCGGVVWFLFFMDFIESQTDSTQSATRYHCDLSYELYINNTKIIQNTHEHRNVVL